MQKRNVYSGKFKSRVAFAALENKKTISEIASEYQIHPNQISSWKSQLLKGAEDLFSDKRRREVIENDKLIEELYRQIGQLKVELDWLKKKSGIIG